MMTLDDRVSVSPPRPHWAAFYAMHERLVKWGQIWLRHAMTNVPDYVLARDPVKEAQEWTGAELESAYELNSRVIRLSELRRTFVLQIFYKAREAKFWYELDPTDQSKIEAEMCREGLARMRRYNADNGGSLVLILRQTEFRAVREAAVWELIRGEG